MTYVTAPTLVQFAGDDRTPRRNPAPTADSLFRLGHDTMQIAEELGCSEAEALKRLSLERSARLGLERPYEPDPVRTGRPKVTT